jgi:hypothetical protein
MGCVKPRWVGFDMDECIGSVIPLYPFITVLPTLLDRIYDEISNDAVMFHIQQKIIDSEISERTWLLRPAMRATLDHIYMLYKSNSIDGAFIFSNNGSLELVTFLCYLCDGYMWRRCNDKVKPQIFKFGAHLDSPFRGTRDEKSMHEIQNVFRGKGLCVPDPNNLLFFDDQIHVLAGEIKHYVRVNPYLNYTPHGIIANELRELIEALTPAAGEELRLICESMFRQDQGERKYIMEKQSSLIATNEKAIWLHALNVFVGLYDTKIGHDIDARIKKARKISRSIQTR